MQRKLDHIQELKQLPLSHTGRRDELNLVQSSVRLLARARARARACACAYAYAELRTKIKHNFKAQMK